MKRPELTKEVSPHTFRNFYYLKEELVRFCKEFGLQATGSKEELTHRIAHYLETGEKIRTRGKRPIKKTISAIHLEDSIEANLVCSEIHRAFYREQIGKRFSFNVKFQKWLKQNAGKTYEESIEAYYQILEDKEPTAIDKQFEYNTYIRAFFEDNKDKKLNDAIKCWQYKKAKSGHNQYEKSDLATLNK